MTKASARGGQSEKAFYRKSGKTPVTKGLSPDQRLVRLETANRSRYRAGDISADRARQRTDRISRAAESMNGGREPGIRMRTDAEINAPPAPGSPAAKAAAKPASRKSRQAEIAHIEKRIDNARASMSIGRPSADDVARTDALVKELETKKSTLASKAPRKPSPASARKADAVKAYTTKFGHAPPKSMTADAMRRWTESGAQKAPAPRGAYGPKGSAADVSGAGDAHRHAAKKTAAKSASAPARSIRPPAAPRSPWQRDPLAPIMRQVSPAAGFSAILGGGIAATLGFHGARELAKAKGASDNAATAIGVGAGVVAGGATSAGIYHAARGGLANRALGAMKRAGSSAAAPATLAIAHFVHAYNRGDDTVSRKRAFHDAVAEAAPSLAIASAPVAEKVGGALSRAGFGAAEALAQHVPISNPLAPAVVGVPAVVGAVGKVMQIAGRIGSRVALPAIAGYAAYSEYKHQKAKAEAEAAAAKTNWWDIFKAGADVGAMGGVSVYDDAKAKGFSDKEAATQGAVTGALNFATFGVAGMALEAMKGKSVEFGFGGRSVTLSGLSDAEQAKFAQANRAYKGGGTPAPTETAETSGRKRGWGPEARIEAAVARGAKRLPYGGQAQNAPGYVPTRAEEKTSKEKQKRT